MLPDTLARYTSLLQQAIAFRSVSTDPDLKGISVECARWYVALLEQNGFDVELLETSRNPIVLGRLNVNAPQTVCVYGHYDVQPAERSEGWSSDPFTLTVTDDAYIGRGVADNKGQTLIHLITIITLAQAGLLGYNIEVVLEGDEESSPFCFDQWLAANPALIKADWVLVSDGHCSGNLPALDISYRGGFNVAVTITTNDRDLHSGAWGGLAPNAARFALYLGDFFEDDGWRAIMQGYEGPPTAVADHFRGRDVEFQVGFMPSIEPTTLISGYLDPDAAKFRNAIPGRALVKVNCRTAPTQDAAACEQSFCLALEQWGAELDDASLSLERSGAHQGVLLDIGSDYHAKVQGSVEQVCDESAPLVACGASIPAVTTMARVLKRPLVMLGLANEDCGMHAVDENITVVAVRRGLAISEQILSK